MRSGFVILSFNFAKEVASKAMDSSNRPIKPPSICQYESLQPSLMNAEGDGVRTAPGQDVHLCRDSPCLSINTRPMVERFGVGKETGPRAEAKEGGLN